MIALFGFPLPKDVAEPLLTVANFGLVVFAAAAVVSVFFEFKRERGLNLSAPSNIRPQRPNWPRRYTVAGLVGTLFCNAVIWETSAALQVIADREAAELRDRAAQAELKLFKLRKEAANRWLSVDQLKVLSSSLSKFADQSAEIVEFPVTIGNDGIAFQIFGVLLNAHWKVLPPERATSPPDDMMVQGIFTRATADERSQAAAKFLFDLLKDTSARGGYVPDPLSDPTRPRVKVYVGDKPAALSDWVQP